MHRTETWSHVLQNMVNFRPVGETPRGLPLLSLRFETDGPVPPPPDWWDDDPVEWVRRVLPEGFGPAHRARLTEADVTAIAEMERGNRATWSSMLHRIAAGAATDFSNSLSQVAAPTLVLHGDADPLVATDRATTLAESIPNARLVMLPGVGRAPWLEQLEEVTSVILTFLRETDDVAH